MKYERLTIKRENGFATVRNTTLQGLIDHLAELEDKIERGELISTVQDERSEQEIAFFVKHNAEVRKQIIEIVLDTEITGIKVRNITGGISMAKAIADALIEAGIGDVKEIKYRVRRAEKALYIACRETAEIIFKDDFDRHAQEYMYGYLKQAEKELSEEEKE